MALAPEEAAGSLEDASSSFPRALLRFGEGPRALTDGALGFEDEDYTRAD